MRWFTSDTHFCHKNIIRLCDRPFADVDEMNEAIIANWNAVVAPEDTVYHLGDVALGQWVEWDSILTRLNGRKAIVVGNHDRIFTKEKERMKERFAPLYAKWFSGGVCTNMVEFPLSDGTVVNLSHFPYDGDNHDADRFTDVRLPDYGVPLIHGHTHSDKIFSRSKAGTLQIHVGMDSFNYTPVSEDQIITLMRNYE
jgi:calcineurin-like phosphoesterase family protein